MASPLPLLELELAHVVSRGRLFLVACPSNIVLEAVVAVGMPKLVEGPPHDGPAPVARDSQLPGRLDDGQRGSGPVEAEPRLEDVPLPRGAGDADITLIKGMDVFISVWNLHRHPDCWEEPLKFDPKRFKRPFQNPGVKDWAGYNPDLLSPNSLYPNEVASDFAFIPFGAGARKCIGDQFAMLEATSCLSMTLQRYEFELDKDAADVGMEMGATIHTAGGLPMKVKRRAARPA